MTQLALLQLLVSLLQKVQVLENELAALNVPAVVATTTPMVFPTYTPPSYVQPQTYNQPTYTPPVSQSLGAVETPTCELTVTVQTPPNVSIAWTVTGEDSSTSANLYGGSSFSNNQIVWQNIVNGTTQENPYPYVIEAGYKAVIGGASCFAYFPDRFGSGPRLNEVSTSTLPDSFSEQL